MIQNSTSALNIVFLDRGTFAPEIELRAFSFPHVFSSYDYTRPEDVAGRIAEADIVIVNKVRMTGDIQRGAKSLKIIGVAATGTDAIDKDAASSLGVPVVNVKDYAMNTVPEHVLGLIFALRRNIKAYHNAVAQGDWVRSPHFCFHDYPIRDLAGARLGIVGRGVLGQALGRLGECLGMKVSYAARKGVSSVPDGFVSFDHMLHQSDVISLHCPLTLETRDLLGAVEFAKMDRHPIVINTARGQLINPGALIDALDQGQISGAGLDVLSQEPPQADEKLLNLVDRPNVLITPHVAWASLEAMQGLADKLVANIEVAVEELGLAQSST